MTIQGAIHERSCLIFLVSWYKIFEESPSDLDQEKFMFDTVVEVLGQMIAAAARAAVEALAEFFR